MSQPRTRRLGKWNEVRGCPGWFYSLLLRDSDQMVTFDLQGPNGEKITGLRASGYRTTTLARYMGQKGVKGYEHVAREAISNRRETS